MLVRSMTLAAVIGGSCTFATSAQLEAADLLVVSHPDLAEAWQPFAEWKEAQGITTEVIDTATIASSYGGKGHDLAEAIRRCVREHIDQNGTKWVILGGDSSGPTMVPDRDSYHPNFRYRDIPTDAFFLVLE